ncbi:hypothetical protein KFZ76_16965 [Methylovulum psychrotolerans]|jgi:hypothetical protein|uniref:hypothetical protein n=1 Tax=Methylovulum psychrotolerans TaxID=1704499 RepID=UPI001BFFCF86|nr:hypothetical protein [Methylovulum psychrotolerans]MBT9099388.1 hypothetical protein [Methylovulum psychrotolerans]
MKFNYGLCLLVLAFQMAHAGSTESYALPPSKAYQGYCQQEALQLHPGMIIQQQAFHKHEMFFWRYGIQASDGSEWLVLCNLANGTIIGEQKLIDDTL